jgi:hypothetical protein
MPDLMMATIVPLSALVFFVAGYTLVISGRPGRVPLPSGFGGLPWRWWAARSPFFRAITPYFGCLATGLVVALIVSHPNGVVRAAFLIVVVASNAWAWHLTGRIRRAT